MKSAKPVSTDGLQMVWPMKYKDYSVSVPLFWPPKKTVVELGFLAGYLWLWHHKIIVGHVETVPHRLLTDSVLA